VKKLPKSLSILVAAALWMSAAAAHSDTAPPVHFETSCAAAAQPDFDRAMGELHSFWAKDAIADFKAVLQRDPQCAMAYWGIAMAHQQNPLTAQQPTSPAAQEALAGLDKAQAIDRVTARERDYIAAIGNIYRDADKIEFRARRLAYEKAMEDVAKRYPADSEAQVFYALALQMTAQLSDKTYANQLKSAQILERVLERHPTHPGVAHYTIHAYDYPPIAERGLAAARLYARLAPEHPHALHMPSHIFTRLGYWQESIETNTRSAAAAKAEGNGQEQGHAMDYMVHAYLQLGDEANAQRVAAESAGVKVNPQIFIGLFALAAMPARYAIERRDWKLATTLEAHPTKFSFPEAMTHYARGLGFAHLGNVEAAKKESERLQELRDTLWAAKDTYWSNQVEVQRIGVDAWIAAAQGNREEALKRMRSAADLEDSMEKHIVTPGPIAPARELLGDMLLEYGKTDEALAAYQAAATREPGRRNTLLGMAKAKTMLGQR
jgi:hypothetical protein